MEKDYSFKYQSLIDAALELIRFDEVERALVVLNQVPAFYRDHQLLDVERLKADIRKALITPHAYMTADLDQNVTVEQAKLNLSSLLRGRILQAEMNNLKDTKPHIVDVGPGEYWVPIGLAEQGHSFTYQPVAMDEKARKAAHPFIGHLMEAPKNGAPTIYVAHEIIEHLPSTQDLVIEALRYCDGWPDYVHLSTPLYTFDVQDKHWNKPCGLPHLRAYTTKEFVLEAQTLFPGYNWEYRSDAIQSLRGYRSGNEILGDIHGVFG